MADKWKIESTSRRYRFDAPVQEIVAYCLSRGTNSYGDGPAEHFTVTRGSQTEEEFKELVTSIIVNLNLQLTVSPLFDD